MPKPDVYLQSLETGQTTAQRLAKEFGDLAARYPAKQVAASIFGHLTDSGALAGVLHDVENMVSSESDHAQHKLDGVERALEKVESNIGRANQASGA